MFSLKVQNTKFHNLLESMFCLYHWWLIARSIIACLLLFWHKEERIKRTKGRTFVCHYLFAFSICLALRSIIIISLLASCVNSFLPTLSEDSHRTGMVMMCHRRLVILSVAFMNFLPDTSLQKYIQRMSFACLIQLNKKKSLSTIYNGENWHLKNGSLADSFFPWLQIGSINSWLREITNYAHFLPFH